MQIPVDPKSQMIFPFDSGLFVPFDSSHVYHLILYAIDVVPVNLVLSTSEAM